MERMKQNIKYVSIGMYKQLEEENKNLKKECEENDYLVEDNARWMKECEEKITEIKKLKEELEEIKNDLEHRDSVLSIMYDLLRSDLSDYEQLCMIDVVIDVEV